MLKPGLWRFHSTKNYLVQNAKAPPPTPEYCGLSGSTFKSLSWKKIKSLGLRRGTLMSYWGYAKGQEDRRIF